MVPVVNVGGSPFGISQVFNTGITTSQIFPVLASGQLFASGPNANFATPTYGTSPVILPVPGSGRLEGKYLYVTACGWVTVGGTTPTIAITFFSGTSLTPGSNTVLKASSAQTLTTGASYPWMATLEGEGDTKSGNFQGIAEFLIGSNLVARAAITPLTAQVFSNSPTPSSSGPNVASEPVFNLCVGVTFGVANAANVAQLDQFVLES